MMPPELSLLFPPTRRCLFEISRKIVTVFHYRATHMQYVQRDICYDLIRYYSYGLMSVCLCVTSRKGSIWFSAQRRRSAYWQCRHSIRSRVYETVRCPSVCPSVRPSANPLLQVCCCEPVAAGDIDRLLHRLVLHCIIRKFRNLR